MPRNKENPIFSQPVESGPPVPPTLENARALDRNDPLGDFRDRFHRDEVSPLYLDGNSLGKLPSATMGRMERAVRHEWGDRLIRSWNEGWYEKPSTLGEKLSPLIGAQGDEVVFSDSTSVNLYKLAYGALKMREGRTKIVSDNLNFPTDLYILQGLIHTLGDKHRLVLAESDDGISMPLEKLEEAIDDDTALVLLSHVVFKSGFLYDMKRITDLARERGALVLWDLSHSAGAVPVDLNGSGAELAVGCSYKYLNGGPGSPAYLYVAKAIQEKLESPVWGWYGDSDPFAFNLQYVPAKGMGKFMAGTPPILSLIALEPAIDMILEAGMEALRKKSLAQTGFMISFAEEHLLPLGFVIGTPRDPRCRGSHVSLRHPEAYRICKALIEPGSGERPVIPDFREPDNIRLGFTPLYTTFEEVFLAAERIRSIVRKEIYGQYSEKRSAVT